jgi:hypothetical protein
MSDQSQTEASKNIARIEITTDITIPDHLCGEVKSKLAYVDESIIETQVFNDQIILYLKPSQSSTTTELSPERLAELERKVQMVVTSMAKGAIKPKIQVLEEHMDRTTPYQEDPMKELLALGEISEEQTGIYTLGPLLTKLIEFFEHNFLALAESFNAAPYRFPTLISPHYLERVNYFSAFPHSLSFVTHLREDLDVIDNFAQHAACDELGLNTPTDSFGRVHALLSPAVCYHLYFALADKQLRDDSKIVTAVGNCFRYEAINLTSLERLWDFTMREVIFVGSKDFVLENRETGRKRMAKFFEKIGLAYRVESANDPFFVGEFRKQAAFQSAFQLKFEILARLPYKGSNLAIGSYNYHQDFFGRNLNITLPDGTPAHTGCVAFGLERVAFAFLAQYGLDLSIWPDVVKEAIR